MNQTSDRGDEREDETPMRAPGVGPYLRQDAHPAERGSCRES